MTKKTAFGSGRTPISLFYRSPRLMLGLSLISGFSILSSTLVIAQTDSLVDTNSAPPSTTVKAAPIPAPEPPAQRKQVVTTIVVPVTPEPRANREYVAPASPPAPVAAKKPVRLRTSQTALRKPSTRRGTSETAFSKPSALRRKPETALRKPSTRRGTSQTAFRKPSTLRRTSETAFKKPATLQSTSQTALKKPSTLQSTSQTTFKKPSTLQSTSQTTLKKPALLQSTSQTAFKKPPTLQRTAAALGPAITVSTKPVVVVPDLSIPNTETVATPPKLELNPAQTPESAQVADSPTNPYNDRTDYSIGATPKDEEAAPVIVTDRSTGCRTVSQNGQLLSGVCADAAPGPLIATRRTTTRDIANKQTANREIAIPQTDAQPRDNSGRIARETHLPRATTHEPRVAKVRIHQPQLARVIIQEPRLARATTQESRLTGIKRLPRVSVAATRPVKIGRVKLRLRGINRSGQRTYTASYRQPQPVAPLPASSFPVSEGWTSPTSLDYYNLTPRPEGRPNTSNANFMFPLAVPSAINSLFGWRMHPVTGDYRFHSGTDIGAAEGTPVLAAIAGQVITADFMGGYGLTVVVQHEDGNNVSLYGHLSEIFVQPGEQVEQGNVIGRVGTTGLSTGPHLHFEWRHLTPNGWVALDARPNIEYALAQFVKSLQVAQATPQPESVTPQSVTPQSVPPQSVTPQSVAQQSVPPQLVPPQSVPPQSVSQRGI